METVACQHFMDQLGELGDEQRQILSEAMPLGGSGEAVLEMIDRRFKAAQFAAIVVTRKYANGAKPRG